MLIRDASREAGKHQPDNRLPAASCAQSRRGVAVERGTAPNVGVLNDVGRGAVNLFWFHSGARTTTMPAHDTGQIAFEIRR